MNKFLIILAILTVSCASSVKYDEVEWADLKIQEFNKKWIESFQAYGSIALFTEKQKDLDGKSVLIDGVIICVEPDSINPIYMLAEKEIDMSVHVHGGGPDELIQLPGFKFPLEKFNEDKFASIQMTGTLKVNLDNKIEYTCYILENAVLVQP
jgi:hypothetical protein